MSTNRKASDILLDLENRVSLLSVMVQNIDTNIKLLLDRVNRPNANSAINSTNSNQAQPSVPIVSAEAPDLPKIQPQQNMYVARKVNEQPYELDEYGHPELMEEVVHQGKRRNSRHPADSSQSKKVAVSQQLLFPDGKAIFLANVEILDQSGQLVKQTRTNSQGRWLAPLESGEYTVHVLKRMGTDNKKPPVELIFKVQIPDSSSPVELPSPELPEVYRK